MPEKHNKLLFVDVALCRHLGVEDNKSKNLVFKLAENEKRVSDVTL